MSMTLADLKTAVYSRLEADASSPDYTAIHEDNITLWANEKTNAVIMQLEPEHFQALIDIGYALTFSTGKATLPTDFVKHVSVKIGTALKRVFIYANPADFQRWDSNNFVLTPNSNKPIGMIADGSVHINPYTGITSGVLDYIKNHPSLSASQDTVFSSVGDSLLIELVVAEAKTFLNTMD